MFSRLLRAGFALAFSLIAMVAHADHGGGGAGSLTIGQSIIDRLYPPESNVYYSFVFSSLDNGLGYTILNNVRGEYAFLNRFSIGASIPVWTVRNDFVAANTKLGDVALLFKAEIWETKKGRMSLLGGLNTSFPTGNDNVSLGAGSVTFSPYFSFLKDWGRVDLFVSTGGTLEADSEVNPTLDYELGAVVEIIRGAIPVSFFLSYQGITHITGDTFTDGSTKGFIVPGFLVQPSKHIELVFLGRISIIDTLAFRPDVEFNDFATGIFNDVAGSFVFNFGYKF